MTAPTVLQRQIGLKLLPQQVPVDFLVMCGSENRKNPIDEIAKQPQETCKEDDEEQHP